MLQRRGLLFGMTEKPSKFQGRAGCLAAHTLSKCPPDFRATAWRWRPASSRKMETGNIHPRLATLSPGQTGPAIRLPPVLRGSQ